MSLRILIADDHKIVREGLRALLERETDMEVVAEAGTGATALRFARELHPDVIVMDITMPDMNGIEATRRVMDALPQTRVLALSMHKDSAYVREILRAGAKGYLLKDAFDRDLVAAVRAVAGGAGGDHRARGSRVVGREPRFEALPIRLWPQARG